MVWIPTDSPLLLLSDNENGSQDFVDVSLYPTSPHTIVVDGDVEHKTDAPGLSGQSSIYFPGTMADYLSIVDDVDDYNAGADDWCIDFFWRSDASSQYGGIIGRVLEDTYGALVIADQGSLGVRAYMSSNGTSWDIANAKTIGTSSLTTFVHYALIRSGTDYYGYQDGTLTWSHSSALNVRDTTAPLALGIRRSVTGPVKGWLDNFRWMIGSDAINDPDDPLYISTGDPATGFTPPTEPYPTFTSTIVTCDTITLETAILCTGVSYRALGYPRIGAVELPEETYWIDEANYNKNTLKQTVTLTGSLAVEQIYAQKGFRPMTFLSMWCTLEQRQALETLRDAALQEPLTVYTADGRGPFLAFLIGEAPVTWGPIPFMRADYQHTSPTFFNITIKLLAFEGDVIE